MNELEKITRELAKAKKELKEASSRTRKYRVTKPLTVLIPPKSWTTQQMEKDYDAALKAGTKHRKLLFRWIELARKHKKR